MLLLLTLAAALTANQPLQPNGKWVVEYDDDMCVLSRSYGVGKEGVTLALRPYPLGTETEVILFSPGSPGGMSSGSAALTLLPSGHKAKGKYTRYWVAKRAQRLSMLTLDPDALDGAQTAEAVTIEAGKDVNYTVAIPKIASGMKALEVCQADLLKSWGIDPAERTIAVTPPKANVALFFDANSYPPAAFAAHQQGKVIAVAAIDQDGKVASCSVAVTSHVPALDEATCHIVRTRVRYSPALDKDGKPIAVHSIIPVRWVLP